MISCPRCGSENAAGSNYCYNCGTSLRSVGSDDGVEGVSTRPNPTSGPSNREELRGRAEAWGSPPPDSSPVFGSLPPDDEPKRRRSRWVTVPLVLIGILLLLCVGLFAFSLTPPGAEFVENAGTWAAEQATEQAIGR